MTVLAIATGLAVLAWIGLAVGLVLAVVVLALLNRVVRPALEIRSYADDILEAGIGIARNLDDLPELERTDRLTSALPGLATAYLEKQRGGAA